MSRKLESSQSQQGHQIADMEAVSGRVKATIHCSNTRPEMGFEVIGGTELRNKTQGFEVLDKFHLPFTCFSIPADFPVKTPANLQPLRLSGGATYIKSGRIQTAASAGKVPEVPISHAFTGSTRDRSNDAQVMTLSGSVPYRSFRHNPIDRRESSRTPGQEANGHLFLSLFPHFYILSIFFSQSTGIKVSKWLHCKAFMPCSLGMIPQSL